jgi:2-oxoisovalerate dehydrogenase E1 component alpha subunit
MRKPQGAERKSPPPLDTMFEDVYRDVPLHLQEQRAQMLEHIAKYPDHYKKSGH